MSDECCVERTESAYSKLKMFLWCHILFILLVKSSINAEILIDNDGGYKNIVVGISPNLRRSDIELLLSQAKGLFRNTSAALFTASQENVFFKEIVFIIPQEYKTWLTGAIDGEEVKYFKTPDILLTDKDVFKMPYTIQPSGCGKPGLQINLPVDFLMSSNKNKALSVVRQWAHYRYGVFSESGFPNDDLYPACYKIPGSNTVYISDCTNEKAAYVFEKRHIGDSEDSTKTCTPTAVSGKNDHVTSSIMTNINFPEMSYFCDDDTRPHNKNAPTKQNALCREQSTWAVISSSDDFRIKSKQTSNVKPAFKYVFESEPNFVVAVDTSKEMELNDRLIMMKNAFSYFIFYDLPYNSTVRIIDMKDKDGEIIEKNIQSQDDARWLFGKFPDTGGEGDICIHCTIQKMLENLKLDVKDIIIITATDITSSWIDNITVILKSNKVALHVIFYEKRLRHPAFLERVAKNSGGTFFYITEVFPPGSPVSSITLLYEAFRSIYESFSWLNRKHVLVDQMTFTNNCSPKCLLSFPSDHSIQSLQVIITGTEFYRNSRPILMKSIVLENGNKQFVSGTDSFIYKSEVSAYVITVQDPQTGMWNLSFERKSGNNEPVVVIVRATAREYGDIINMQVWTSNHTQKVLNSEYPPITIYSEIKKHSRPVIDVEVTARIHQASYNTEWLLELKDSGDGDPDITKNDGIFSRYLTDIVEPGYYSITVVAEKKSLEYHASVKENSKEINCCGSSIPSHLSYDSGYFKRVTTYPSFFVEEDKAGKSYPPRRVVDLRIDRIEMLSHNVKCYILIWTAPGDNYDKGKALSYDLKVFNSRKTAFEDFHTSHVLTIKMLNIHGPLLEPEEAGTIQTAYMELTNLTSGTYFIALKTTSHSGKISDVSNVVELTYAELNPSFTDTGISNGEFYTFPIDGTTETDPNKNPLTSETTNFGLAIGLTCGILFLLLLIGLILFIYLVKCKKAKEIPKAATGQNTKKTESNDALFHANGDGHISIISPVTSWGANSLISHYETVQQNRPTDINGMLTTPESGETDSLSLASSKCSYVNKLEQNSSIYDPVYYHQVQSQDELNYPYNPTYAFDPMYTSSLRRLHDGNIDNPYCSDNASYCGYSLNRNIKSRLNTDV